MDSLRFTILGCGSSGGVPRIGNDWGDCDPTNPKNRRRRCSLLVERVTEVGTTTVLIDTSPDMREQLLDAQVGHLDAVVYTHSHADHVHGIDDLRQIVFNLRRRLPVWADAPTQESLIARFGYAFVQPEGSPYPPILDLHTIRGPVTINGAGVLSLINPANFEAPADQNADNVYQVIVQVSDGTLTDTQTINVTVTNANEAPVITSGGGGPSAVVNGVENSTSKATGTISHFRSPLLRMAGLLAVFRLREMHGRVEAVDRR